MNFQSIFPNHGLKVSSVPAGIRQAGRLDTVLFEFIAGTSMAGVFTQNKFCAAPVVISKKNLVQRQSEQPSYWLVNTGYANAGTGDQGYQDALQVCDACARLAGVAPEQVLPFSTGIIGEPLPVTKLLEKCPELVAGLTVPSMSNQVWLNAASGIMTTDTRPKIAAKKYQENQSDFIICGLAKGAGMIHPNMATMLGFLVTDLYLPQDVLAQSLKIACDQSFNCISVDGDTSTNDSVMLASLPAQDAGAQPNVGSSLLNTFQQALNEVCLDLALQIVRDAEGGRKCVQILVEGAACAADARRVADTIATSPLVKTAVFAEDPNWGRILAATGRSGVTGLDIVKISMWLDEVSVVQQGERVAAYEEHHAAAVMRKSEFCIRLDLGQGSESARIWTSDLSVDYVKINADYRS